MAELKVRKLTSVQALRGLIGYKSAFGVYFTTRFGIHTFFMKFPVDIVILDKDYKVRVLRQKLAPNRLFIWNPKYFRVLELPDGTIREKGLKIGDKLNLSFV